MRSLAFNTASFYYFWAVELDNRTAAVQSEWTNFRHFHCYSGCVTGFTGCWLGWAASNRVWGGRSVEGSVESVMSRETRAQGSRVGLIWVQSSMTDLCVSCITALAPWAEVSMSTLLFYTVKLYCRHIQLIRSNRQTLVCNNLKGKQKLRYRVESLSSCGV